MVPCFSSKYFKSSRRVLSLLDQSHFTLPQIKQIQSHLIVSGTIADPYAAGKLIALFAVSDHAADICHDAYTLFRLLPHRSTFVWNTMIRAFAENNEPRKAMGLYKNMVTDGFVPNNYTFSFVVRACAELSEFFLGLMYHAQAVRLGWEAYDFVQNGLIHFYATCNHMSSARKLFDASLNRDVITWTAVINGYAKSGQTLFARQLFDEMPHKNAVSWSAMINGYVQIGLFKEALDLFTDMQIAGIRPNHAAIVGALSACASLGALDQGRWIHAFINKNKIELDTVLGTSLIDMYSKSGFIETAQTVFDEMPHRDVFAYTSLISGWSNHGKTPKALKLFTRMQKEGTKPNEITFITILSACSRIGLVQEGLKIFKTMTQIHHIEPGIQHYGCLVDLLGRAGLLEHAKNLVQAMPMEPDSYVLGALLNACRVHGEVKIGKEIVEGLVNRCLDHSGVHVLLSNIYASVNYWDGVEKVRKKMEEKNVKKVPGCSLIEVDGMACEFIAGDRSNLYMEEIEYFLVGIDKHLKSLWMEDDYDDINSTDQEQVYL